MAAAPVLAIWTRSTTAPTASVSRSRSRTTASGTAPTDSAGRTIDAPTPVIFEPNLCDGADNDCDGQIDEDFVGEFAEFTCNFCPLGSASQCVDGQRIASCSNECAPAESFAEWQNYLAAYDFDVAADKLCIIDALGVSVDANSGPPDIVDANGAFLCTAARVACNTDAGGLNGRYEVLPAPADFSSQCAGNQYVAMDPNGRVWAATLNAVYMQKRLHENPSLPDLVRIANKPDECTGITQLEVVGQPTLDYFGPSSIAFIVCGERVFQLDTRNLSFPQWIARNERISPSFFSYSLSIGASPRDFDLYYLSPFNGASALTRLNTIPHTLAQTNLPGLVGGVYVYGLGGTGGVTFPNGFRIQQWNGTALEDVSALGRPLPTAFQGPVLGRYDKLVPTTTDEGGIIRKIVEGGGVGIGGPSPRNTADALWILNDTARIYSYNVQLDRALANQRLTPADNPPITVASLLSADFNAGPTARCHDVTLSARESCLAVLTDPRLLDNGSSDPTGDPLTFTLSRSGGFPVGSTPVTLRVSDGTSSDTCTANVIVTDDVPPAVTPPPNVSAGVCFGGGDVNVGTAMATDNCGGTLEVRGFVVSANGTPPINPIPVVNGVVRLQPGTYIVEWTASDGTNASAPAGQTVTITGDAVPPVLTVPSNVTAALCQTSGVVTVGTATATDACPVTVTGQVISTNGTTLATPIAVTGGQATLGFGTHVVSWRASDGFNQTTGQQTVVVGTKIQARESYQVSDRAVVRVAGGTVGAAVLNSGTGATAIRNDARTGAVLSRGPVTVLDRAIVSGTVVSAGNVTVSSSATTGAVTQNAAVFLPALPSLPAFPPATGGSFTQNAGTTRNLAPGSYATVTLNGSSTVNLVAGDYFFQSLTVNAAVNLRAVAGTRVFVRDQLTFRSSFTLPNGSVQPVTLGFAGAGAVSLEARFDGTLIAPNGALGFGAGSGLSYTGSFFGRAIDVRTGSSLFCQ